jgi:hypothetical protein
MSVFIVIKVMMVVTAISSLRVHTVRGTIRSAGCYGNPIYWANAYDVRRAKPMSALLII